jgi:hypothetical protein
MEEWIMEDDDPPALDVDEVERLLREEARPICDRGEDKLKDLVLNNDFLRKI